MAGGAHMRWNVSIALRVAKRTSEHLILGESVLRREYEALALPIDGGTTFPPAVPHVPLAAHLPIWCDVPGAYVVLRAAVGLTSGRRIQHASGSHKHMHGAGVERVARQLGAQCTRRERLTRRRQRLPRARWTGEGADSLARQHHGVHVVVVPI